MKPDPTEKIPARLYPFEHRFLSVDGIEIHYVDEGSGPTILFLHGNPTWSFLYRDIIRGLRETFRCVALDYPGFGLSEKPEHYGYRPEEHARVVEGFVERLGLENYFVMGQDWGGPIGLWVAGRRPERIAGLILGNTWAWPVNGDWHFEWFSRLFGGAAGKLAIREFNLFVRLLLPGGVVHKERLTPEVWDAYLLPFRTRQSRLPTYVFPRSIRLSGPFLAEVEEGLPALKEKPVLILWGSKDPAFRSKERMRLESYFPNHMTVLLGDASHFIQEDAPEQIVREISNWHAA
ncbi:MAG TPA: alpha/beta fold hydrolase [Nitrospiria bacterium]|nr:alpha/beta fold hydrolase [Nitrospiria bacterium]